MNSDEKLALIEARIAAVEKGDIGQIVRQLKTITSERDSLQRWIDGLRAESRSLGTLVDLLAKAQVTIQQLNDQLLALTSPPYEVATVVQVDPWSNKYTLGMKVFVYKDGEWVIANVVKEIDSDGDIRVATHNDTFYYNAASNLIELLDGRSPRIGSHAKVLYGTYKGQTGRIVDYSENDHDGYFEVELRFASENHRTYRYYVKRKKTLPKPVGQSLGSVVVSYQGQMLVLEHPDFAILPGQKVSLNTDTKQIVSVLDINTAGEVAIVRESDGVTAHVEVNGVQRYVQIGDVDTLVEPGHRVILDTSGTIIINDLGGGSNMFQLTQETNITWDDIGGLQNAKLQLREVVEGPILHAELQQAYGGRNARGVLLLGQPGCGKTLLGKAAATAMAHLNGGGKGAFLYIKGPEILDRWVGSTEATIRQIFMLGRRFAQKHGYPPVLFIDEADALLRRRGSGISSDVSDTIVPMFLAEMDGLEESGIIVILATNRPDILDPAVVRDYRMDRKIHVGRPDADSTAEIFRIHMRGVLTSEDKDALSQIGVNALFDDNRALMQLHLNGSEPITVTLANMASKAMVEGIVQKSITLAMRRDQQNGRKPSGVCHSDVVEAVNWTQSEQTGLDHTSIIREVLGPDVHMLTRIEPLITGHIF